MKSAVETLNPTRVKLTVEVPFEELKPSLDAAYAAIGNQVQIPGFRKGKVPARIIEQRFGRGAVVSEAINEALPEFYGQAIEENDLQPLGQPEVDITGAPTEGVRQGRRHVRRRAPPDRGRRARWRHLRGAPLAWRRRLGGLAAGSRRGSDREAEGVARHALDRQAGSGRSSRLRDLSGHLARRLDQHTG